MTKPSEEVEATAGATKETDVAAKGIKPAKLTAIIVAAVVVALAGIGGGYAYWTHHEGNAYHEAVASSGNVQLILDIFNKTGVPAYVSRLCSGGILSLRNHVAVDVVQFVSPVASVATRGRWSQALNESLPANEPSAVAPGVRERRVLKFADRLPPVSARTVACCPRRDRGETPYVYISEDGGVNQLQVRFAAAGAAMWMVNIYPRMLVQQVVSGAMRGAPQRFM